jgi:superfamily II DNA helicase RecQ
MLQFKFFTFSVFDETAAEEVNKFIRTNKVVNVKDEVIQTPEGIYCCFRIQYTEQQDGKNFSYKQYESEQKKQKQKVNPKQVLGDKYPRFIAYREIRTKIFKEKNIPAFEVFNDNELVRIAEIDDLTFDKLKTIADILPSRVENHGELFCRLVNEMGASVDGSDVAFGGASDASGDFENKISEQEKQGELPFL